MNIRKVSETATTITLGWDPVPGADGYRFYSAGVLRSKTMDPRRRTVKFSKGQEPYRVEAVVLSAIDSGSWPADTPPPPPPSGPIAPRTYNTAPGGEPSARFCVAGLPRNQNGRLYDIYSEYDDDGHDLGGRTTLQVPGLKPANEMDGRGPCDPYGSFPPWPAASYER